MGMTEISEIYLKLKEDMQNVTISTHEFITYIEDNDWFGIDPIVNNDTEDTQVFLPEDFYNNHKEKFLFFFSKKQMDIEKKRELIIKMMEERFPKTIHHFKNFDLKKKMTNSHFYHICDFFLTFLSKEIEDMTNSEIQELLKIYSHEMPVVECKIFAYFLNWLSDTVTKRIQKIEIKQRKKGQNTKYAYDFNTVCRLYYVLFSETCITENRYYEIIAKEQNSAVALLFLSIHMLCDLRDTDICRLPRPNLPYEPQIVLEKIENGNITDVEAIVAVEKIERELHIFEPAPNKTKRYKKVPYSKLFIPENAKAHMGRVFLAAEAHFQLSAGQKKNYIYPITTYEEFEKYLCDDIADIFWDVDYSSRSLNKSYSQLIKKITDIDSGGNIKATKYNSGYMLVSFARSHKGGYEEFAKTTSIYLKDEAASGHSMDFIVQELFERGVCSFAVSLLLEMLYQEDFRRLPMNGQTSIIQKLDMTPYEVEQTMAIYERSLQNASDVVHELTYKVGTEQNNIRNAITRLAFGNAASKQNHVLCMSIAFGQECPYPQRGQCIGCPYEILTKSTLYTLASEYEKHRSLYTKAPNDIVRKKYELIIRQVINLAIIEILTAVEQKEGEVAVEQLMNIVKGVIGK